VSVTCSGAVSVAVPMTSPESAREITTDVYTRAATPFLGRSSAGPVLKLANTTP
jgi:hypothetical protein